MNYIYRDTIYLLLVYHLNESELIIGWLYFADEVVWKGRCWKEHILSPTLCKKVGVPVLGVVENMSVLRQRAAFRSQIRQVR